MEHLIYRRASLFVLVDGKVFQIDRIDEDQRNHRYRHWKTEKQRGESKPKLKSSR